MPGLPHDWLLRVLSAMGIDPDLIQMISAVIDAPSTRVRINSGYSGNYRLVCGLRQGDPLSCLLYNFSIEPLGMCLRSNIKGLSVQGLPPAKVTMFRDDTNIFLSAGGSSPDDIPRVFSILE